MAEVLNVTKRELLGTANSRRLRRSGKVPAVLYGHGQECVSLSVPADQLAAAIRHTARLIDLQGDVDEPALISDVQWDTFSQNVLHVDFTRVSKDQRVEMMVAVELRGEAPGAKVGGVVSHLLHEIKLECLVTAIPEKLSLSINTLELNEAITASDIVLPEGAVMLTGADIPVVHCMPALEELEEEELGEGAEPEVIGLKADEEEDS